MNMEKSEDPEDPCLGCSKTIGTCECPETIERQKLIEQMNAYYPVQEDPWQKK